MGSSSELTKLLSYIWDDPWAQILFVFVCILAAGLILRGWERYFSLRRALKRVDAQALDPSFTPKGGQLGRFQLALQHSVVPTSKDAGERYVVNRTPSDVLMDGVDSAIHESVSFNIGSTITAFALFCTFLLIALVLVNDISTAVKSPEGGMENLSAGLSKLGAKFLISAVGVVLTAVHLVFARFFRRRLMRQADKTGHKLRDRVVTLEVYREGIQHRQHAIQTQLLTNMERSLSELGPKVQSLSSINVCVQDLSENLTESLQRMMTNDMGREIKKILVEVMLEATAKFSAIEEKFRAGILESFSIELSKVGASLTKIESAITNQSMPQFERIVDSIKDALSGGFHSGSTNMQATMERFAAVVPLLEQQLKTVVNSLSGELRARSEETNKLTGDITEKVGALVDRLSLQQEKTEAALQRLSAASAEQASESARQMTKAGEALFVRLSESSTQGIGAVIQQMSAATNVNSKTFAAIEQQMSNVAATIDRARAGLGAISDEMTKVVDRFQMVLQQAQSESEGNRDVSQRSATAANSLITAATSLEGITNKTKLLLQSQADQILSHQQNLDKLQEVWPNLFQQYLDAFDQKSRAMGSASDRLLADIERLVNSVGSGLSVSFEGLSDEVEKLTTALASRRA